jgi:tetratricopeptide (TPR) repeat protein
MIPGGYTLSPEVLVMSTDLKKLGQLYDAERMEKAATKAYQRTLYDLAEQTYQRAIKLYQTVLGTEDGRLVSPMRGLAANQIARTKLQDAETTLELALGIAEKAHYAEHFEVALVLHDLGVCYALQDKYAEAEECFTKALTILGKCLQKDHRLVLTTTRKLVAVQGLQKKYAEAEKQLVATLKVADTALGPAEDFILDLALVYQAEGKASEAEGSYEEALERYEQRSKYPGLIETMKYYAEFVKDKKKEHAARLIKMAESLENSLPRQEKPRARDPESHWKHLLGAEADTLFPATQVRS